MNLYAPILSLQSCWKSKFLKLEEPGEGVADDLEVREQNADEDEDVTMWSITHDEDDEIMTIENMITFSVTLLLYLLLL